METTATTTKRWLEYYTIATITTTIATTTRRQVEHYSIPTTTTTKILSPPWQDIDHSRRKSSLEGKSSHVQSRQRRLNSIFVILTNTQTFVCAQVRRIIPLATTSGSTMSRCSAGQHLLSTCSPVHHLLTCSAGFITRVQPAASAGAHFQASIATSKTKLVCMCVCVCVRVCSYRIVPGNDLSNNSNRFHPGVGHHLVQLVFLSILIKNVTSPSVGIVSPCNLSAHPA